MAAMTKDNPLVSNDTVGSIPYPVKANVTIYQGAQVCVDGTGYLVPGSDTSGLIYVGQAIRGAVGTSVNGAVICPVIPPTRLANFTGFPRLNTTGATIANSLGIHVFLSSDQDVVLAASSSNKVGIGRVVEVLSTTIVVVDPTERFAVASS